MELQVVIYKGQEHLDTDIFYNFSEALNFAETGRDYATGFNIFSDDNVQEGQYNEDGSLTIRVRG